MSLEESPGGVLLSPAEVKVVRRMYAALAANRMETSAERALADRLAKVES